MRVLCSCLGYLISFDESNICHSGLFYSFEIASERDYVPDLTSEVGLSVPADELAKRNDMSDNVVPSISLVEALLQKNSGAAKSSSDFESIDSSGVAEF